MPKLIKRGTKLEETFRGTCQRCGSEIEWKITELSVQHDRDGRLAQTTCIECDADMWAYPTKKSQTVTHR
jgi:hypothetical protein